MIAAAVILIALFSIACAWDAWEDAAMRRSSTTVFAPRERDWDAARFNIRD